MLCFCLNALSRRLFVYVDVMSFQKTALHCASLPVMKVYSACVSMLSVVADAIWENTLGTALDLPVKREQYQATNFIN